MKHYLYILLFIFVGSLTMADDYNFGLTCSMLGSGLCPSAMFNYLNVTTITSINQTVLNINVTGEVNAYGYLINGTGLTDIYMLRSGNNSLPIVNMSHSRLIAGIDSRFGDANNYMEIKKVTIGALGDFASINFMSNSVAPQYGVFNNSMIIYDINGQPSFIFSNADASSTATFLFNSPNNCMDLDTNLDIHDTAFAFRGRFNWTTKDDWNQFDGYGLLFNESKLNLTLLNYPTNSNLATNLTALNNSAKLWVYNGTLLQWDNVNGLVNSTAFSRSNTNVIFTNLGDTVKLGNFSSINQKLNVNGSSYFSGDANITGMVIIGNSTDYWQFTNQAYLQHYGNADYYIGTTTLTGTQYAFKDIVCKALGLPECGLQFNEPVLSFIFTGSGGNVLAIGASGLLTDSFFSTDLGVGTNTTGAGGTTSAGHLYRLLVREAIKPSGENWVLGLQKSRGGGGQTPADTASVLGDNISVSYDFTDNSSIYSTVFTQKVSIRNITNGNESGEMIFSPYYNNNPVETLRIQPSVVNVTQNLVVSGNMTGNNFYAGMFFSNPAGATGITLNQSFQIVNFSTSLNDNGFSFLRNNTLQLTNPSAAGLYKADWRTQKDGTNNHVYQGYIFINEQNQSSTFDRGVGQASNAVRLSGFGMIRINYGDNVTLRLADTSGTTAPVVYVKNVNLVRIAN